ncbi:hypothetical protein ElyMa_000056100, partial [Elysia marginata]
GGRQSLDEVSASETMIGSEARLTMDDLITFPTAKPEENNFRSDVTNFTKVSLSFVVKEVT